MYLLLFALLMLFIVRRIEESVIHNVPYKCCLLLLKTKRHYDHNDVDEADD